MKRYISLLLISVIFLLGSVKTKEIEADACFKPCSCDVIFATMVIPGRSEAESVIWAKSLRDFGGRFSDNPLWIFVPETPCSMSKGITDILKELGVEIYTFCLDEEAVAFPLAAKPFAAAEAERVATGKCTFLAWIDPDNIFVGEPSDFILPDSVSLGYRPVHHINVGSIYDRPADRFWASIYNDCGVTDENIFRMRPNVEDVDIRPYINAGHLIVRPERRILAEWCTNFNKLYLTEPYKDFYEENYLYQIFVHQAVLSATILSYLERKEMSELPAKYNYPLNLYADIPEWKRVSRLNDLITARYDNLNDQQRWLTMIRIDEPLKSWINERFPIR